MASNITTNYLYSGKGPFDAKMWVKTYADLFAEGTFPSGSAYQGMIVAVGLNTTDTTKNGIYYLFDSTVTNTYKSPSTAESNWHKVAELSELEKLSDSVSTLAERITALEAGEGGNTSAGITEEQLSDAINALRTEITEAGYLTVDDLTDYAKKTDLPTVPTKVSELENDAGYLTEHQSLDGKADVEHTHKFGDIDDAPNMDEYAKIFYLESKADIGHTHDEYALKTDISGKADQTVVDALAERIDSAETSITGKANTSDLENYATNKSVEDLSYELNTALDTKADSSIMNTVSADVETLKTENASQSTKLEELQSQIDALSGIEGSLADFATDKEVESAVRTAIDSNEFIVYGTF